MAGRPSTDEPTPMSLSVTDRAEIESWFVRRGVPQLIDDYTTELQMDARALPYVVAWLVVCTILFWGARPDWPVWLNVVGVLATLSSVAVGLTLVRVARGHVMWWVNRRLETLDTWALGPLIAIPAGLVEGSVWGGINDGLNALAGIGIIYVVVGLGLLSIGRWSLGRLRDELVRIAGLVARTLPILLILVLFLVFAAELWEAAHLLRLPELAMALLLFVAVAALLVLTAFRSEMRSLQSKSWDDLAGLAADTPAARLASIRRPEGGVPRLRFLQRLNLAALVMIAQLIQSAFVALVVTGFLVAFGVLVLPAELQQRWIGEPIVELVGFRLLGEPRTVSMELVNVATLLGSVVGLYFTGLAITDSSYRTAHFERMLAEVRQLVAGWSFYASAVVDEVERRPRPVP